MTCDIQEAAKTNSFEIYLKYCKLIFQFYLYF